MHEQRVSEIELRPTTIKATIERRRNHGANRNGCEVTQSPATGDSTDPQYTSDIASPLPTSAHCFPPHYHSLFTTLYITLPLIPACDHHYHKQTENILNRSAYFDFIEAQLSWLATRIDMRGGLNILDLHLHSENFYLHFCNLLFGWKLTNLNLATRNAAGIDLVDTTNKIVVQVSATASKQKVESALAKDLTKYGGYSFKFISISKDAKDLRTKSFSNPSQLSFSAASDIFDVPTLLETIASFDIVQLKSIYDFLKAELKIEPDANKVESNLATLITILSKQTWSQLPLAFETVPYGIEAKISYNQLDVARYLIDDYKIHYHRIDRIYSDFDKQGANKSTSVLNGIRSIYLSLGTSHSPDNCFLLVIAKVIQKIRESANYAMIPDEELELCVQVLVVDAFVRCKIFRNPSGNSDAYP